MSGSYLFLLLVEVVDDHTNKEVEGEEGAEYDEDHKVDVHVDVAFVVGLVFDLRQRAKKVQFRNYTVCLHTQTRSKSLFINFIVTN